MDTTVARHGLTQLYEPPKGTATVALILFVHGLFGHPYRTWAAKPSKSRSKSPGHRSTVKPYAPTSSANSPRSSLSAQQKNLQDLVEDADEAETRVFWPRDLLPNVVHDARILTWGYDADIDGFGSASQSTIHQHAGSLLSDLADQRGISECYRRPILFVVHSLGGIIVKAALNKSAATQGTRLKEIAPATFGVCFLGTPHRGSSSASLGKIAYKISRTVTRRPNTKLLQGLERNSETLEQIGDTFAQTMLKSERGLRVYSFREEKETRKYLVVNTTVVKPDSAMIGDPYEEVGSVPANHSEMTKFESSEAIGFKRIAAQLRRWVQELRMNEKICPEDVTDCMNSLSILETKLRILDVNNAYEATFHWLFDPDVVPFSHWLTHSTEESKTFFWIQGKPGSGKSTLMKFAMRDPRTLALLGENHDSDPPWTLVAFFFHDRGSSIQKSLLGLLREVIDSTMRQLPQLILHALVVYKDLVKSQRTKSPDWHFEALKDLMDRITKQRQTRVKLLLFLDALDEHEGDNDLLLQLLKEWTQNADGYYVTLKICLASRSWPIFTQQFESGLNLAIDHFTKDDIRLYTDSRLSSSNVGTSSLLVRDNLSKLIEQITTKARGVFIWVRLVTDRLAINIRDGTPFQVLSRIIAETPEELQELYDDTLRRINVQYANETHVMFQIILHSLERLPLETLVEAVVMSLDRYLDSDNWLGIDSDPKTSAIPKVSRGAWLMSRSGGLLETSTAEAGIDHLGEPGTPTEYVQFLHQTSKEYIQSSRAQAVMKRMAPRVAERNGYYFLSLASQSCFAWVAPIKLHMLIYMKLTEFYNQTDENIFAPFYCGTDTATLATSTCGVDWWIEQQGDPYLQQIFQRYIKDSNFYLRVRAYKNGLNYMLGKEYVEQYHYGYLLFYIAANLGSMVQKAYTTKMKAYMDRWVDIRAFRDTCLLQATIGGPNIVPTELQDRLAMVKLLLALGYSPDTRMMIPPDLAVWPTMENAKNSSSKTTRDRSKGSTPAEYLLYGLGIVELSHETRIAMLDALLDYGANIEAPMVSYCAQYQSAEILRTLFRHGVGIDQRDDAGWLPIDYALLRGDREVLAVFDEFQSEPLRAYFLKPNRLPNFDSRTLVGLSATIYAACGHPGLAILFARRLAEGYKWANEDRETRVSEDRDTILSEASMNEYTS
ncbi:MAG: hypothetical protein Q9215_007946 [Flavoplaca cf. flavocitrina]